MARDARIAPLWVTALLVLVGVALAAVAVVYFADTAGKLPSFFPGHAAGSSHHHTKHGILAAVLALVAFAVAWMSTAKRRKG
jgi:amino acid permease